MKDNINYPWNLLGALSVHPDILKDITFENLEQFIEQLKESDKELLFLRYKEGLSLIKMSYQLKMSPEGLRKKQEKVLYDLSNIINNECLPLFLKQSVEKICDNHADKEKRIALFNNLLEDIPLKSIGIPSRQYLALLKTKQFKNLKDLFYKLFSDDDYSMNRFYRIGEVGSEKIVSVLKRLELNHLKDDMEG